MSEVIIISNHIILNGKNIKNFLTVYGSTTSNIIGKWYFHLECFLDYVHESLVQNMLICLYLYCKFNSQTVNRKNKTQGWQLDKGNRQTQQKTWNNQNIRNNYLTEVNVQPRHHLKLKAWTSCSSCQPLWEIIQLKSLTGPI